MREFTENVTHLRVHDEGDGWALDGASAGGEYTEKVWTYDSVEEALAAVPEFTEALAEDGIIVPIKGGTVSVIIHRLEERRVPVMGPDEKALYAHAASMLDHPEDVDAEGSEYVRGMVELIMSLTGKSSDDKEDIARTLAEYVRANG